MFLDDSEALFTRSEEELRKAIKLLAETEATRLEFYGNVSSAYISPLMSEKHFQEVSGKLKDAAVEILHQTFLGCEISVQTTHGPRSGNQVSVRVLFKVLTKLNRSA